MYSPQSVWRLLKFYALPVHLPRQVSGPPDLYRLNAIFRRKTILDQNSAPVIILGFQMTVKLGSEDVNIIVLRWCFSVFCSDGRWVFMGPTPFSLKRGRGVVGPIWGPSLGQSLRKLRTEFLQNLEYCVPSETSFRRHVFWDQKREIGPVWGPSEDPFGDILCAVRS